MNLHVLTYNVFGMPWGLKYIESVLIWSFYKTDAEILCFQEVFSKEHRETIETICGRPGSCWTCWFPTVEPTWLSTYTYGAFESITGLCILVKKDIQVIQKPVFHSFEQMANVDRLVRKGFFHLTLQKEGKVFHLLTTHFQSDFTECRCRIRYQDIRIQQELQLFRYMRELKNAVVVGDFNTSRFYHFQFVNSNREATFPDTGESLDHCLCLDSKTVSCTTTTYFHELTVSDHIPVLFHLRFLQS